ncbi:MAG TPA: prolyl oligopeptidase family serine peptidase [Candidatus Methylacidiphilales bacterium]|nr:prolyl oligopeptidase family serine peptidase [Candidatus Methylacidiphilales bacterium]
MRTLQIIIALALASGMICHAQVPASTSAAPVSVSSAPLNPEQKRLDALKAQPLAVNSVFSGDKFPKIDIFNRELVEAAVGPVTQSVRYFDAQWNEVTAPTGSGRYGAMATFTAGGGFTWTRRITLYKTPQPYSRPRNPYQVIVEFPPAFGIPPALALREYWNIRTAASRAFGEGDSGDDYLARTLAGLRDIAADPARWQGFSYYYIDRAWWAGLGRHLGENQDYQYLSYFPPDYDKDPKHRWPLLLFLHGSGERGHDLKMLNKWGPLTWVGPAHPEPMIIIEPQCPDDEWWDPARLARLLDQVSAQYRVDPKRLYVTGLSMGGYGTLEFAAVYPQRVTALASLSGGEDPALAPRLKGIPSWFFHGAEDDVVPPSMSIDLAHALQKLGAPAELTLYPGVGHGTWDMTYNHPALYSWFLSQSK